MKNKILILDIETTDTNPKKGHIVEIGIVTLDIVTGDKEIIYDKIFQPPNMTVDQIAESWICEQGYMDPFEIFNGEILKDHIVEIQNILFKYERGATAFNNAFDFRFMESEGIVFPVKLGCPMLISTPICKVPYPSGRAGDKWPKVEEAYNFFFPGNTYKELHRGADDAFHEADIVFELIKRGKFKI